MASAKRSAEEQHGTPAQREAERQRRLRDPSWRTHEQPASNVDATLDKRREWLAERPRLMANLRRWKNGEAAEWHLGVLRLCRTRDEYEAALDYPVGCHLSFVEEELADARETRAPEGESDQPDTGLGFSMIGDLVSELRPVDWLVKQYLETDSLGLIFGPPNVGKSFVAIDWACSIATGTPWHGRPVRQGSVFYLAGEGHNGLARRFKAWELDRGVSLAGAPLAVSNRAALLTEADAAAEVLGAVEALAEQTGQEPAVIVVDTLSRNFGADENATADMNAFVRSLDELRQRWKCSILVVHHSGKDATKGARGSTVLRGAVEAEYAVEQDELGAVTISCGKMKDAAFPAQLSFTLAPVKLPLVDDNGEAVTSVVLEPIDGYEPPQRGKVGRGKNQTLALRELQRLYVEHHDRLESGGADPEEAMVRIDDWRDACGGAGISRQRFHDVKASLERAGEVLLAPPYVRLAH
ncbi:AAA family ATPase [Halomonas stenophila]|uniref:AAA+ ATPase domain-containing protein n=1 Tax=Halomonas stenophila TaxID=795312 RepID=A0A7W5EU19_9GAMM|nr:helicase RepA family protein [Halomonas stenophila]MBB3231067.1 hypothetical protein [Halomonas stenophila]